MNRKKIVIISLIAIAVLGSVSAVSAGFLDGLFGEEKQDNVIELDNITFNTTNITKFKLLEGSEGEYTDTYWYVDENDTGYNVHVFNATGEVDETQFETIAMPAYKERYDNLPTQTVNGVVVYTMSSNSGDNVGEPRYAAFVQNNDLRVIVDFSSPDPNETAKMALSLKFNK